MAYARETRRELLSLLAWAALTWPSVVRAQQPAKLPRIGFLVTGSLASLDQQSIIKAFVEGLSARGYVEGRNIATEYRGAEGKIERFPALARELVALKVDLIVASNTLAARAARQASATMPIVVPIMGDPVGDGLVASLGRPGGNVTGLTFLGPELTPKRLELLKEILPKALRVAALWHPGAYGEQTMAEMLQRTEAAARVLGVQLQRVGVRGPDDIEGAFTAAARGAEAIIVFPSPMLFSERRHIVELAVTHRLALMGMAREFADLGGLSAYGANLADLFRRSAGHVERILKGAKPADIPVEQPTKFELVVNLKTAKDLGIAIPVSILVQADEVIE
jgi:putative ABC transport system substrate-binding protein